MSGHPHTWPSIALLTASAAVRTELWNEGSRALVLPPDGRLHTAASARDIHCHSKRAQADTKLSGAEMGCHLE